jgi:hypothetical protein
MSDQVPGLVDLETHLYLLSKAHYEYGLISIEYTKDEISQFFRDNYNIQNATPNNSPQPVKTRHTGYVYLLQSPTKAYKIGRSKNPENRLKTFSVKLPFEVEYIALIKTNDMVGLERQLHQRFADKRVNGEWFELSSEDVQYIQGLSNGQEK